MINQKFTAPITALKTRRHETELSKVQAQQIISRMEGVLEQLPVAIKQAHKRIIGGRRIANEEKILSFYDDTVNVIVRGKAGANVEFGNELWLDGKSVTASTHVMQMNYQTGSRAKKTSVPDLSGGLPLKRR